MRQMIVAELRGSVSSWLAVSFSFVATNAMLALCFLLLGARPSGPSETERMAADGVTALAGYNVGMCVVTGLAVVGTATSLVINARRGSVARLALAGATPRQVTGVITGQLAVVSLLAAAVGDVVALASMPATLGFLAATLEDASFTTVLLPANLFAPMLWANLIAIGVAMIGGYRQARRASRIPPVEALREAAAPTRRKFRVGKLVNFVIAAGITAAVFVGTVAILPTIEDENVSQQMVVAALFMPVLAAWVIAAGGPVLIQGFTRLWTALVPRRFTIWHVARATVLARGKRLEKSVVPVMFTIALLFGLFSVGASLVATQRSLGSQEISGITAWDLLPIVGTALIIAFAGSVGSLVMMARQRDAELALVGVAGGTPAQQRTLPLLEAAMITVTAVLLGVGATGAGLALYVILSNATTGAAVISLPVTTLLVLSGIGFVLTASAVALPSLPSLRQPAPKVIQRLIAA